MILSNAEICQVLDSGRLIIRPEPVPRPISPAGRSPFQTTAVDLRLGNEIHFLPENLPITIDLTRGRIVDLLTPHATVERISEDRPFVLQRGKFVLGQTLEWVELPLVPDHPCLAARIEGRSSYARCGLLVHFTAPTIHAGFRGHITLELINWGPAPISLTPGIPICQLILEEVLGCPIRNDSQFQGQTRPGGTELR